MKASRSYVLASKSREQGINLACPIKAGFQTDRTWQCLVRPVVVVAFCGQRGLCDPRRLWTGTAILCVRHPPPLHRRRSRGRGVDNARTRTGWSFNRALHNILLSSTLVGSATWRSSQCVLFILLNLRAHSNKRRLLSSVCGSH